MSLFKYGCDIIIKRSIVFLYVCSSLYKKRNFNYIFVYMRRFRSRVSLRTHTTSFDSNGRNFHRNCLCPQYLQPTVCVGMRRKGVTGRNFNVLSLKTIDAHTNFSIFDVMSFQFFIDSPCFGCSTYGIQQGKEVGRLGGTGYIVSCRTVYLLTEPQSIFRKSQRLSPTSV